MKKFAIITNSSKDKDLLFSKKVEALISSLGGESLFLGDPLIRAVSISDGEKAVFGESVERKLEDCECIIVLGGDGTIIETARALGDRTIPLVGINLGTLGFLSCIEKNRMEYAVKELIEDRFTIEDRMMLKISFPGMKDSNSCFALNDVTITRSGLSRIIQTDVYVNGDAVGSYFGDGCLVSTPTGSTGYNLSAGGPIVTPEAKLMCISPICPHSLNHRSIVVSGDDKIRIVIGESKKSPDTESFATIDGQIFVKLNRGDIIDIEQAEKKIKFIRFPGQSYFKVLKTKLER